MEITSLGFRTDVMVRRREGAEVVEQDGYVVVRSPANPAFWWGNFLLIPWPGSGGAALWLERFSAAFPGAAHVALGVDVSRAEAVEPAEFVAAGLTIDRSTVLTATAVRPPPRSSHTACIRPLAGDEDWRQSAELRIACLGDDQVAGPDHEAFLRRRAGQARALTEAGHGTWLGAFDGGRLLAQVGVVRADGDLVRYQDVETHPAASRQGLAGALIHQAGLAALAWPGVRTVVIVADPGGAAVRLYRSAGFADAEDQVAFARAPVGP